MPVIQRQQDEATWLDRENFDANLLQPLLVPYDHDQMGSEDSF
ncbi:SOS response-associated peptidase [Brevibacillus formosus]|nr:SOS response-associated peptidase [Brevibacillus formosus]